MKIYELDAFDQNTGDQGYALSSQGGNSLGAEVFASNFRYTSEDPLSPAFLGPGTIVTHNYVNSNYTLAYSGTPTVQQQAPAGGASNFTSITPSQGLWMKRGGVLDFAFQLVCNVPSAGTPPAAGINIVISPPTYAGAPVPIGGSLGEVRGSTLFLKNSPAGGGTPEPIYGAAAAPYISSLNVSSLAGGGILFNILFGAPNWSSIRTYGPTQRYNIVGSGATTPAPLPIIFGG